MIIVLFDKTEFIVSDTEGQKLENSLARNDNGFVKINGSLIKKSAIAYTRTGGKTEAEVNRYLPQGDYRDNDVMYRKTRAKIGEIRKQLGGRFSAKHI